ncbi:MAG: hypothetical protein J7J30_01860 [Candidatus Odinarchaeota archaeon]|nr:hypothetical protein [Candidatus Odinarchaeota archaeon]
MKVKLQLAIVVLLILLMEFSTAGLMATGEGKILDELASYETPEIYIDSFNPNFQGFKNGTPVNILEEEIISRVTVSPLSNIPNIGQGITLNSNVQESWLTGKNATGYLSMGIEKIYEESVANINRTGILVLAFLVTDIAILNETLFSDERTRIVVDEILKFAEEVGDAAIIMAGNYCTAINLMYLLRLAEQDRRISETYLIILTHGVLNETLQVHGMLMHGENNVAVVNGETLKYLVKELGVSSLSKLKFVYLPFCNMGREKEIYGNSSVVSFFEELSVAAILTYDGETYLNGEYIASVQSVLSSGTYELAEEHVYLPVQIVDNFTSEVVEGYVEFRVVDEIEETNSTVNPYEIYDNNNNITLGFKLGRRTTSRQTYRITLHRKHVKAIIHRGKPPRSYVRKRFKHISYYTPPKCKVFSKSAKTPKINFRHKARSIPFIVGRFWRPPKAERKRFGSGYAGKLVASVDEVRNAILLVDEIFNAIYKNYYGVKNAVYRWIDATFNAPWSKWMRKPVKSILDNTVFRGANFIVNFAKQYLKTVVSVAYSMIRAGKTLSELVAALIIAAIAKFANGILKYFSWTMDKLLGALSKVLSIDLNWVRKILRKWVDRSIKFLDNAVAYSERLLKNSVEKFINSITSVFNTLWKNAVKPLLTKLLTNFMDFTIDAYLQLAEMIATLVVEGGLNKKLADNIMNTAAKIINFLISIQPPEVQLSSYYKLYMTWLYTGLMAGVFARRDNEKSTNISWHHRKIYREMENYLGKSVKYVSFTRFDDIYIIFRQGQATEMWRDANRPCDIIGRVERIVLNEKLSEIIKEGTQLVEYDKESGKIKRIILEYGKTTKGKKRRRYHSWYGDIAIIQTIHMNINGESVEFSIVWHGYLNQFTDPYERTLKKAMEKFDTKIQNGVLYSDKGKPIALMSKFIPCEIKTEDITLKGYRIVLGIRMEIQKSEGRFKPCRELKENYGKIASKPKTENKATKTSKLVEKLRSKGIMEFIYRFDHGTGLDDGMLGKNWLEKTKKVKQIINKQAEFWRTYANKYKAREGKLPSFYNLISQSVAEVHPLVIDNHAEIIIKGYDPVFLNEILMQHTELCYILKKVEERLEEEGLTNQKKQVKQTRENIENWLKQNYKEYYEKLHTKVIETLKQAVNEAKTKGKLKKNMSADKIRNAIDPKYTKIQDGKKIEIRVLTEKIRGIYKESGNWNFRLLDNYRNSQKELRIQARNEAYLKDLGELGEDVKTTTIELPTKAPEKGVIQHHKDLLDIFQKPKVKETFKNILGKSLNAAASAIFIIIFATTCFTGHIIGIKIYKRLPNNVKMVLKTNYGKIYAYMALSLIAKILIDVDDWQDTWNVIKRTKGENSIKNVVKTAVQTFLGCMLNGILIGMYLEGNINVVLADNIIPYIAQTVFGDNAWIFTKIIYPLIDTAIQIIGNGGPTMYLIGTILGNTWTQLLQQAVNW